MSINNSELDLFILKTLSSSFATDFEQLVSLMDSTDISARTISQRLNYFNHCGIDFSLLSETQCQLAYPLDLLDISSIKEKISKNCIELSFERYNSIDSTNTAIAQLPLDEQHAKVCLAEYQTAGRGRHGRQWLAPFASALCLSLGWRFELTPAQAQLISFLPAVALVRVLRRLGVEQTEAKWPNDIVCIGHKLAGVLIETFPNKTGQPTIILGIGLNVYNRSLLNKVPQPVVTLEQLLRVVPTRNELVALLVAELLKLLQQVENIGLETVRDEWQEYDAYFNQPVCIVEGEVSKRGISRGINPDGSLLVEIDGQLKSYMSGEISLRADKEE